MLSARVPYLGAMCLVRDHDNVVALCVALARIDFLIKLLDQREHIGLVLGE